MIIDIELEIKSLDVFDSSNSIWKLIEKYKINDLDLTSKKFNYRSLDIIVQPIKLLSNTDVFCIKYKLIKGCSNCKIHKIEESFYTPYIDINIDDIINNNSLEITLGNIFKNTNNVYDKCGYDSKLKIYNEKSPSCYNIFMELNYPPILFLLFELTNENLNLFYGV